MLCVVRDVVDPVQDQRLAEFVVGSHARSHPSLIPTDGALPSEAELGTTQPDIIPQDMLRKYITYAKQARKPAMKQV